MFMKKRGQIRRVLPVLVGNCFEFYDFALYGLLAPVFATYFFSSVSSHSVTIAFGIFAIAYIARPVGVLFWGGIADRYGRKPVLVATLTMMAIPAIGMACVPSYESIGIWASIFIVTFRLFQGFACGGEFPTVMVMLYELAPDGKKALFTSLTDTVAQCGKVIAILFLAIISSVLSYDHFTSWGWKILFLFSLVFIFIVSYIRLNLTETLNLSYARKSSIINILMINWRGMVKIILYMAVINVLYFSFIYHS
ncbi:MFS transporter, partial [Fangia hongkongensis]